MLHDNFTPRKRAYSTGLNNAIAKGREDRAAGTLRDANPYRRWDMRKCWFDGWDEDQALRGLSAKTEGA